MCQNTTMRVYGPWIKTYCVLCSKHVVAMSMCYNPALVRDKLLWTPASVKRVYWVKTQCGVNLTYPVGTDDIETWRNMMTSSNGNIFRVTSPLCGEFTGPGEFPTREGQWREALMFSLIYTRIKGWVNNGEAGDLRRYRAHSDVTVMTTVVLDRSKRTGS